MVTQSDSLAALEMTLSLDAATNRWAPFEHRGGPIMLECIPTTKIGTVPTRSQVVAHQYSGPSCRWSLRSPRRRWIERPHLHVPVGARCRGRSARDQDTGLRRDDHPLSAPSAPGGAMNLRRVPGDAEPARQGTKFLARLGRRPRSNRSSRGGPAVTEWPGHGLVGSWNMCLRQSLFVFMNQLARKRRSDYPRFPETERQLLGPALP